MTASSFLNSFKRFIAVRSQPKIIYPDNATQFKAANKFLSELWNKLVVDPQVHLFTPTMVLLGGLLLNMRHGREVIMRG